MSWTFKNNPDGSRTAFFDGEPHSIMSAETAKAFDAYAAAMRKFELKIWLGRE